MAVEKLLDLNHFGQSFIKCFRLRNNSVKKDKFYVFGI